MHLGSRTWGVASILAGCLGMALSPSSAQTCYPLADFSASILPSPAIAGQDHLLNLQGDLESCARFDLISLQCSGDWIFVTLEYELGACGPSYPEDLSMELELGSLSVGRHLLTVWILESGGNNCGMTSEHVVAPAQSGAGVGPSATLLFPYFEVDLEDDSGVTTLVSIGNSLPEPVLAHAVLWTDTGIPTLAFDLLLPGNGVQPLNLRHVLGGNLPITGGPGAPGGCLDPLVLPAVDEMALRARHTGQSTHDDGLCWGSGRAGPSLATGYLTVDVVHDCTPEPATPIDDGYFAPGGSGRAANLNALWGDYFYLSERESSAQGLAAVQIPAGPAFAGQRTFYAAYSAGSDERAPLGSAFRSRFLVGGSFTSESEQIVWIEDVRGGRDPRSCELPPSGGHCDWIEVKLFDQIGSPIGETVTFGTQVLAFPLGIGGPDLPLPDSTSFGFSEIIHQELEACFILPLGLFPRGAWVTPRIRASGRYGVAFSATRVD